MNKNLVSYLWGKIINKSNYEAYGDNESPFNDLAKELKSEHFQWVIAISVALLVSIYANGFGYMSLILDINNNETPVYQCLNLTMMTIILMFILLMYGRYVKHIYPKLVKVNEEQWLKENGYTEKRDALELFKQTVFGWRLLVRLILYLLFILFWFGIKYSFGYYCVQLKSLNGLKGTYFGDGSFIIVAVTVMVFLFLLESPVIYSYYRIKQIYERDGSMLNIGI